MTFEKDYKKLISYAEGIVKNKRLCNVNASDLVNDAFVSMHGIEYSFEKAILAIANFGYRELDISIKPGYLTTNDKVHYCTECNESKPVNGFYFIKKNGVEIPRNVCKDCTIDRQKKYYQQNKQKCLVKYSDYKERNKGRIRLKKREYYLKVVLPERKAKRQMVA